MQKLVKIMAIFLVVSFTFTGCTRKEPDNGQVVTIRYLNFENLPELVKLMKDIINAFEKENPDIKVKLEWGGQPEKVLVEFAGGDPPDVFFLAYNPSPYVKKGVLLPLNEYLEKYNIDLSQYYKPTIDYYTFDGKLYALPLQFKTIALVYNKDIFNKAGLRYPDENWTWDDYLRVAKSLCRDFNGDGRNDQFGCQEVIGGWETSMWIKLNGGKIFDFENGRSLLMEDERTREALEFVVKLRKASLSPSEFASIGSGRGGIEAFCMGRVVMFTAWGYLARTLALIKDFQWDVAPVPKAPDGARRQIYTMGGLCIPSRTKHPEEAFRFVKFYCGETGASIFAKARNGLPAHRKASQIFLAGPPAGMKYFGEETEQAICFDERGNTVSAEVKEEIMRIFWNEMDILILEQKNLNQSLKDASSKMETHYRSIIK